MRGVGAGRQSTGVDSERGGPAVQRKGSPGEDGHSPQADLQADLPGHERRGGVHLWESQKQSAASSAK